MKVSFPLSLKVSLWLLLNLLLLGAVALGFFATQGGLSWDALVAGRAGGRIQSLANVISGELLAATPQTRDAVLTRFASAYGVTLTLVDDTGKRIAGSDLEIPTAVTLRTERHLQRLPLPPDFQRELRELAPTESTGTLRTEPPANGTGEPMEPRFFRGQFGFRGDRPGPRFVLRDGNPSAYWIGVLIPISTAGVPPPHFGTLLIRAGSFWTLLRVLELMSWLLAGAAVLVFSVLFWLPLVRSLTRAIKQLTFATEKIAEGKFETRVPTHRGDELGQLGDSVNRMAARLDTLAAGQKRFLGDVAHELCSPLARLQMATSILEERAPIETQSAVADVREEVQQMNALVNELLAFTKAGLKAREVTRADIDVATFVNELLARENIVGRVVTRIPPSLHANLDPALLSRALANLVRNAQRYASDAGAITVSAARADKTVSITVDDEGPGVPTEALDRLGEPFYRPEGSRTRETGGVGLGLSIVRTSMTACGGTVRFSNRSPRGFRAELIFTPA